MSHLTLAGRRCKVAGKEYKCIFHRKSSERRTPSTAGRSRREKSGTRRKSSDAVPWYIAMSGPRKRKVQAALRAEEAGEQLNYIPLWGGTRSTARTGRYGLPRNQYRSRTRRGARELRGLLDTYRRSKAPYRSPDRRSFQKALELFFNWGL